VTRAIIGVGQPLSGDDAVGREVARRLGGAEVADGAGLLAALEGVTRAVVIDAALGPAP
jgi:Ni,Fe-hydrogenase maturation factor